MRLAWRTECAGHVSLVAAHKRAQAVGATLDSAREAGYRVQWTDVACRRWPEYDFWAKAQVAAVPKDPEYVPLPQEAT